MTREERVVCDFEDIGSYVLECGECRSTVTVPVERILDKHKLVSCPACNARWTDLSESADAWLGLMSSIRELVRLQADGRAKFRFRMELRGG